MKKQLKRAAFLFYALILIVFFATISALLQPPGAPEIACLLYTSRCV